MKKLLLLSIILSLCFVRPCIIKNKESDFERLKYIYPNLTFEIFNIVYNNCHDFNVDIDKMFAVIKQESNFNPNAFNAKSKDYGLCQINWRHNVNNPEIYFDLATNIKKGISIYKNCENISKGNFELTCMRYNKGPNLKDHEYNNILYALNVKKYYLISIFNKNKRYLNYF